MPAALTSGAPDTQRGGYGHHSVTPVHPGPGPAPFVSRTARWLRPELVAEVTFGEWTDEGILRYPSYIATRDEKDPRDVVRET